MSACSALVFVAGLEVTLRIAGYETRTKDRGMFVVVDDRREYALAPRWSGRYFGVNVRTNSLGVRGDEVPFRKEANEIRVLVLGDSVTFGYGVEEEEGFVSRTERILQVQWPGQRIRVINGGVIGWNTVAEAEQFRRLILIEPDVVVLAYTVDNDADLESGIHVDRRTRTFVRGMPPAFDAIRYLVHRHSAAYAYLRDKLNILWASLRPPRGDVDSFAPNAPGWLASQAAIIEMERLCSRRGVSFLVGGIALVLNRHGTEPVAQFLLQRGIPYVELWKTDDLKSFFEHDAVTRSDGHPNAPAHAIIARRLAAALEPLIASLARGAEKSASHRPRAEGRVRRAADAWAR